MPSTDRDERALMEQVWKICGYGTTYFTNPMAQEIVALIAQKQKEAVYSMHEDIIGIGNLELGQESDLAFNYGRIHKWIDSYIERNGLESPDREEDNA